MDISPQKQTNAKYPTLAALAAAVAIAAPIASCHEQKPQRVMGQVSRITDKQARPPQLVVGGERIQPTNEAPKADTNPAPKPEVKPENKPTPKPEATPAPETKPVIRPQRLGGKKAPRNRRLKTEE